MKKQVLSTIAVLLLASGIATAEPIGPKAPITVEKQLPDSAAKAKLATAPADSTPLRGVPGRVPVDSSSAKNTIAGIPAPQVAPADSFNPNHGAIAGIGVGFFLGSSPVFSQWQQGLPEQLSDLGLADTSFRMPGDSGSLGFSLRKSPDIYNIIIPVSAYFGFITPVERVTAGVSFGWQSKDYDARITKAMEADSVTRYVEIRQSLNTYSLTFDLTYGRRIPERFFSVDNIDRTDMIIGLTGSPWISLKRSGSVSMNNPDARMAALVDSILPQLESFTSAGFAYGWRIGIATLHHTSAHGGLAAEITYSGMWNTNFRYGARELSNQDLDRKGSASALTYYSSKIGVTISLFRKFGGNKIVEAQPQ